VAPIRVALVEDQEATRKGLPTLINAAQGLSVCAQFGSMEEAIPGVLGVQPDVLLADIGLPGISGIEGVRRIHEQLPELPILMLTVHGDDDLVFAAVCAGACGYLLKETEPERLVQCIREVQAGGAPMSPEIARKVLMIMRGGQQKQRPSEPMSARQWEVLCLLAEGNSYKACAEKLNVSIDTVRFHVRKVYDRLHVNSRTEAVAKVFGVGRVGRAEK
jgi:DNA-binding NarL/FixJ family response regulator